MLVSAYYVEQYNPVVEYFVGTNRAEHAFLSLCLLEQQVKSWAI